MIEIVDIATWIGILGALCVMLNNAYAASGLWCISNPILAHHNFSIGEVEQARLFTVFFLMALLGIAGFVYKSAKSKST